MTLVTDQRNHRQAPSESVSKYILPIPMTIYFDACSIPRHNAWELIHIGINEYVIGSVSSLHTVLVSRQEESRSSYNVNI